MRHVHRTVDALYAKALTRADRPGTFEAVVSVYGNRDSHGDAVEFGAFAESLNAALPPVVWSHDWLTPPIGVPIEMAELDRDELLALLPNLALPEEATGGLYAKGRLLVDVDAGEDVPLARHVHAAFTAVGGDGRSALREFSWGGRVVQERVEKDEDSGRILRWVIEKARMDEFGPCLVAANPLTELVAAKAARSFEGVDLLLVDVERGALSIAEARKRLAVEMGWTLRPDAGVEKGADAPSSEPSQDATAEESATAWAAADAGARVAIADALLP